MTTTHDEDLELAALVRVLLSEHESTTLHFDPAHVWFYAGALTSRAYQRGMKIGVMRAIRVTAGVLEELEKRQAKEAT